MYAGYIYFPILEFSIIIFSIYFCYKFKEHKKTPLHVSIYFIFSLVLCMTQLALLPLDFNDYLHLRCTRLEKSDCDSFSQDALGYNTLKIIWTVVYWTNFVNIWYVTHSSPLF